MSELSLLLISGSLRKSSLNTKLAWEAARLFGGTATLADINLPLYDGDLEDRDGVPEAVQALADQIAAADAVVISTPEYNQSFPGGLKNALDWISRTKTAPWKNKPVALISAAAGRAGGARAQYALRLAMTPFQPRLLTGPEVLLAGAGKEFDASGQLVSQSYIDALQAVMDKLRAETG